MMQRSLEFAHAALRAGRDDAEALSLAAYTMFQCDGSLPQIDELVQRSLHINPGISICHYNAGYINVYAGRSEQALAAYGMALRLDPRTPWHDAILIGQAQALFQLERYAEALPLYAQAESAFPAVAPAIRRMVAICHLQMGNSDRAQAMLDVHGPITHNEEFLISRYRDPDFRRKLRDGIAMLAIASSE
jgi:tetratricopeptide (TPR) repeat protein